MEFSIRTADTDLLEALLRELPDGISVIDVPVQEGRSIAFDVNTVVIIQVASSVALGIVSNWLYDHLKSRRKSVQIKHRRIEVHTEVTIEMIEDIVESDG